MVVEQVSDEGQIKLVDTVDDILGRHKAPTAQFLSLLEHNLSTAQEIAFLKVWRKRIFMTESPKVKGFFDEPENNQIPARLP